MQAVIIVISLLLFVSCSPADCPTSDAIATQPVTIPVERLEQRLFAQPDAPSVRRLLRENPGFTELFLHAGQYPSDSILANKISRLLADASIDTLHQEATAAFGGLSALRTDLEMAVGKLQTLYPNTRTPKLQTAVTGFYNDLYISDSLIVIGLDYFLGSQATYRPRDIPGYVLTRYTPHHLAGVIVKFMAGTYVSTGNAQTLISEMVDFGKTYYLTRRLLPCTPDSILLGYTPADMKAITENEQIIWANFVENEILYETSHITKRKFLGERPKVYEISQQCPGRIGAWIGWRIVEAYMKSNDVSIHELITTTDNNRIFRQSGYKPRNR